MEKKNNIMREPLVQDGIFFILLALGLFLYAITSYSNDFTKEWSLSPYLFPLVASVFLVLLGTVLLIQGMIAGRQTAGTLLSNVPFIKNLFRRKKIKG